ncbi:MAG: ABC transporter permease [Eubacteriales bacterium]|nr:ABC transporter permease [Eubacteriales bacterium]
MKNFDIKKAISNNVIVVFLILLCLFFGVMNHNFFSSINIMNLLSQMCVNALLASGLSFAIILGGIDISVGSQMAVTGVVAALIASKIGSMNTITALLVLILTAIVIGCITGGIIGSLIAYGGLIPMICTLAFLTMLRGLAYIISGGGPIYGLDSNFGCLGARRLIVTESFPNGMIPTSVIFTVIIVCLMHFLLSKTIYGRHVFAVGSNKNVAHLAGIDVKKVTLIGHILCAVTASMAGVVTASKLQNGQPNIGEGYEMFAIASCVLGGTSLIGGRGSVARAMFGVAVIAVINNGMNLLNISAYWQKVVIGGIIIIAVLADTLQQKRASKN